MPTQEVRDCANFLLWARSRKFAISRVKVGHVEIEVAADMEIVPTAPSLANKPPTPDPYEQFGGAALQRLAEVEAHERSQADALIDEDDEEDVQRPDGP